MGNHHFKSYGMILILNHATKYDFDLKSFLVVICDCKTTFKITNHYNIIVINKFKFFPKSLSVLR